MAARRPLVHDGEGGVTQLADGDTVVGAARGTRTRAGTTAPAPDGTEQPGDIYLYIKADVIEVYEYGAS